MSDPVKELKRELLAAAERRQRHAAGHAGRLPHPGRTRLLIGAAALVVAVTASLLSIAPRSRPPSFLAQAEAALSPQDDVVLHQRWVATTTSNEYACTVRHRPSEIWIDQAPPHRYRVRLNDAPPPRALRAGRRALACWNGQGTELGGRLDADETLELARPGELRAAGARFVSPVDPVADLRRALETGTAHDEGETTRDGRTVRRIRVDPPEDCAGSGCPREPTDWYVDPNTFHPVASEGPAGINVPGRPFVTLDMDVRFLAYDELPRTAATLALTDIRAQHPRATGP